MKKLFILMITLGLAYSGFAQTEEELKAQKAEKQAQIDALQAEANDIQAQIDALPGWETGAFGTIGANISGYNNWFARGAVNNSAGNIGITFNGFANLDREKDFWNNALNVNIGWIKNDNKDIDTDSDSFDPSNDVFSLTSLYGRKLSPKFAISALGEYRTTLLDNFNDPGYLDLGAGATWLPIENMVVSINPLNYNFVFSDMDAVFESSMGAKILVDYTKQVLGGVNFKSNFSTFQSYKSGDLSSWTWVNSFGYTLWKGIGLGFEFGMRQNKQEALGYALSQVDMMNPPSTLPDFDNVDNDLQTYWLFGLNYSF
ncbi:MAG: DUF3078 domain-containing protein [Bacteroidia bacterium]|nr:DUF3078 domain-containing protein [Bacteroidia bacterium]MBT8269846.1 DUF3078 domain-containing protein [Bacteroidia bacterium]NNF83456.1 DUF3078 domain-containing protein [Flavobacteriaceae bacterium]NNK70382.1 DUF3078 domain-containing protein [Flavobacteriaceae bacterium]NNL79938.1 DUF3078 domain-containing protein [Flavobacteriaceae bacterium]